MLKDYLEKGLIKRVKVKELNEDEEKPRWYNDNLYYGYHQVKVSYTNSCFDLNKRLKAFLDEGKA